MVDSDFRGSLKEALHETINGCLSAEQALRLAAEQRLTALEVIEEYGLILTEIVVNPQSSLAIRLMASVLLKQYVETHWSTLTDKFHPPEVKPHIKEKIKELLPLGLSEAHSKLRLTVAAAISKIAQWEWPENWAGLFDILVTSLKGENWFAVHGAMRVLTEFSRDLTDAQLPGVGEVIIKEMYRIFENDSIYNIRTRARAVGIFTTIASLIADTSLCFKGYIEKQTNLLTVLPLFCEKFVQYLGVPNSLVSDCDLKTEIIRSLNTLICKLPKYMANYVDQILPAMWRILTESAKAYQEEQIDQDGVVDDANIDSDGEVINFNTLITATFDFISAINDQKKYLTSLDNFLPEIMYHIIIFMQITEEQIHFWSLNPKQFLEEEDPLTRVYSVRVSAQEFLENFLTYSDEVAINALCSAITKHIELVNNPQYPVAIPRNADNNWKLYEACIASLITSKEPILELHKAGKLQFDLIGFLNNIVLSTLNNPGAPQLLLGRCLCVGGCFAEQLPLEMTSKFLEATVMGLQLNQSVCINVSAIKATGWFCHAASIENSPLLDAMRPYLNNLFQGVFALSAQPSSEILAVIMDTYAVLVSLDEAFTASIESKICPYTIAVFLKYHHEPDIFEFCTNIFEELSKNPNCVNQLHNRILPTLVSMIDSPPDSDKAVDEIIQANALKVLSTMVQFAPIPLSNTLIQTVFPGVCRCVHNATEVGTVQQGGEVIRTYISKGIPQILEYRDNEGRNGIDYILQVVSKLLNPQLSEFTALLSGRLVVTLIKKAYDTLGESLDILLRAVLSKMQQSESECVIQSLLSIWSYLFNCQFEAVLSFLSSVPGPTGNSALDFVLKEWVSKQELLYQPYERRIAIVGLCKILEHGVTTEDSRLNDIHVEGDVLIENDDSGVRTRAKSRSIQYPKIPVLIKIFKLIIYEYEDCIEENSAEEDIEESDNEEGSEEDRILDPGTDNLIVKSFYQNQLVQQPRNQCEEEDYLDDVETEEDPEIRQDPIYKMDLRSYLEDFLLKFSTHKNFQVFIPHLNPREKRSLTRLNINVLV